MQVLCDKFRVIEKSIQDGEKLTKVDLSDCGLSKVPLELLLPCKDTIEFINVGGNSLSSLPDGLAEFSRLRILFFAQNKFKRIPSVLGRLSSLYMLSFKSNQLETVPEHSLAPSLYWLILTDNKITELPSAIGNLKNLRKLLLSGNLLESLPDELQRCRELELIRLSVNRLRFLPSWLFTLPKLSWIALSSNDFHVKSTVDRIENINYISWNTLVIEEKLGEGASGEIYKAISGSGISSYV
jgi:Leucine-rich repeat (LRR) protein